MLYKTILRSALVLAVLGGTAAAASPTICGDVSPSASGCPKTSGNGIEANEFDSPMPILAATGSQRKLLVFFHGHGGDPGAGTAFRDKAQALGYDVISLDFAYGRDYVDRGAWSPSNAGCGGTSGNPVTCGMSLAEVCGCYSDCFGYRWRSIWLGGTYAGLPTVTADWTINARLAATITWAKTHVSSRFGSYLDSSQLGGIAWNKVTLAGHSLGASLVGYMAKWQAVDRVIMLSGTGDSMAPHTDSTISEWTSSYGCDPSTEWGTDVVGQRYRFPKSDASKWCQPTTYRYGVQTGLGYCTLTTQPVGWVADNFGYDGGTNWATSLSDFYAFDDSNDATNNWEAPYDNPSIATRRNLATLGIWGIGEPNSILGTLAHPGAPSFNSHYHGVLVIDGSTDDQVCTGTESNGDTVSGHNATISGSCSGTQDLANREAVYQFLLTN